MGSLERGGHAGRAGLGQLAAHALHRRLGLHPQRVVGLHAEHEVHAALEVETEPHLLVDRVNHPGPERDDRERSPGAFQRRFLFMLPSSGLTRTLPPRADRVALGIASFTHPGRCAGALRHYRVLALVADDGRLRARRRALCRQSGAGGTCRPSFVTSPYRPPDVTTRSPTFRPSRNSCTFFCRRRIGSRITQVEDSEDERKRQELDERADATVGGAAMASTTRTSNGRRGVMNPAAGGTRPDETLV